MKLLFWKNEVTHINKRDYSSSFPISSQPHSPISSHPTSDNIPTPDDILDISDTLPLRRSTRHVTPHLFNYICNATTSSPWCALIAYSSLPPFHTTPISWVEHLNEPVIY